MSPTDGTAPAPPTPASRSPLFEAHQAPRYERQRLIREYQEAYSCRLVVMKDHIFPYNITPFEDTLFDANPNEDLHLMLETLGGDGETALRLIRQAQLTLRKRGAAADSGVCRSPRCRTVAGAIFPPEGGQFVDHTHRLDL